MLSRRSLRAVLVTLSGTLLVAVGPVAFSTQTAVAAPAPRAAEPEFPFQGDGENSDTENDSEAPERDTPGKRAEKTVGGVVTELIDFSADLTKCGLNIATPNVECPL